MIPFADNAEGLHVETGVGQSFHCLLRRGVIREDGDHGIGKFHWIFLQDGYCNDLPT
jgi:hypothetical protein